MKSAHLYHVSINSTQPDFYKELLSFLGFKLVKQYSNGFGVSDGVASIWVFKTGKNFVSQGYHRQATGLNHIALRVASPEAVDKFHHDYLLKRNIPILYSGPKEYPEYEPGYYSVYFEDPDRIKLEVVYKPD